MVVSAKLLWVVCDQDVLPWMQEQSFGANRCENDSLKSTCGNGEDNLEDSREPRERFCRHAIVITSRASAFFDVQSWEI
jgi:hypothetical protein